jgi:hypothetical protein
MADATLRDLTAATDIAATDVLVIQNTDSDGAYYKITGANFNNALESGGGIALSLAAAQVAAAGADTRVQYNNGGARGGDAEVTWDNSGKALTVGAKVVFGDGDSGVAEITDDLVWFFTPSSSPLLVSSGSLYSGESGSGALLDEAASSTNPTIVLNQNGTDTGVGLAAADKLSLIAGGLELARLSESTKDQVMFYCPPIGGKSDFTIKNRIRNSWFTNGFGFFVDEDNDKLEFWARYSNGDTVKNHELALA